MKKQFALIAVCSLIFATSGWANPPADQLSPPFIVKKDNPVAPVVAELPSFTISAPAQCDYTPVMVIRPKTAMLIIDNGDAALPKIVSPVLQVAHGPPKI